MKLTAVIFSVAAFSCAVGAEVVPLSWETRYASAPASLAAGEQFLPAFRTALVTLPEAVVVQLALSQPAVLGLNSAQAAVLQPLVTERYRLISESPAYAKAQSLLPYCFSDRKPALGAANLYVPDHPEPSAPVILFLHGYGGSFLWYQHWLSEVFPGSIILCPAYGISPVRVPVEYLKESMAAAEKYLGFPLRPPTLIGLSAGGGGACRAYVAEPEVFSQFICMGTWPAEETLRRFPKNGAALFLAGGNEPFVATGQLARSVQTIRSVCPRVAIQTIPQADHFFLLTHPQSTKAALKRAISD